MILPVTVRGTEIKFDVEDHPEGRKDYERWRVQGYTIKEPETLDWIDRDLQDGDLIYDIGANIGLYSLYAALTRKCHVVAVEPESLNYAKLNRNIRLNGLCGTVLAVCAALGTRTGIVPFYVNDFAPGAAYHAIEQPFTEYDQEFAPGHQQLVSCYTLDDMAELLSCPNMIKIDVDGIEPDILTAGPQTLSDPRLRSLLVEQETRQLHKVKAFMEGAGFTLVAASGADGAKDTVENYIYERQGGSNDTT